MKTQYLSSSLRSVSPEQTIAAASKLLDRFGITRVSEITRLDRVGIPVFASIRPDALPGSLCVNAGKGLRSIEAHAGAYMEAIEFAAAEYRTSPLPVEYLTPKQIYPKTSGRQFLNLCPQFQIQVLLEEKIACVQAAEIVSGERKFVPAELVFMPYPEELGLQTYFGSGSNGLCSGNTVQEAAVHGICELLERDTKSFLFLKDTSFLVEDWETEGILNEIFTTVQASDLSIFLRYSANQFEIPYFEAFLFELDAKDPIYISGGYGCHPIKQIAAVRALTEACQSRLSFIHGGRDDLIDRYELFGRMSASEQIQFETQLAAKIKRADQRIGFAEIPDYSNSIMSISSAYDFLQKRLQDNGFDEIYLVNFNLPSDDLHVLRMIIPKLEAFDRLSPRIGSRLAEFAKKNA
ncbi:MAG: YcaO-like family protein [Candidatus Obscuribacterales bacterium]